MRHGEFTQPWRTNKPLQTNREAAKEFPICLRNGGLKRTVVVFILEVVPFERNSPSLLNHIRSRGLLNERTRASHIHRPNLHLLSATRGSCHL